MDTFTLVFLVLLGLGIVVLPVLYVVRSNRSQALPLIFKPEPPRVRLGEIDQVQMTETEDDQSSQTKGQTASLGNQKTSKLELPYDPLATVVDRKKFNTNDLTEAIKKRQGQ